MLDNDLLCFLYNTNLPNLGLLNTSILDYGNIYIYLLINLRSPRDYVGLPFFRSFALSPLDGASVREAHCEQASVARLVTFESLKWKYSFATNSALFI